MRGAAPDGKGNITKHGGGCVNLGNPAYRSIGIGYYEGVWTVDFTDG